MLLCAVAGLAAPAPLHAASPIDVYNDFAADGRIDGSYPPNVLEATADDASLFQYGDPLTSLRLRRAVRRQLVGGRGSVDGASRPVTAEGSGLGRSAGSRSDVAERASASMRPLRDAAGPSRVAPADRPNSEDPARSPARRTLDADAGPLRSAAADSGLGAWTIVGVIVGVLLVAGMLGALRVVARGRRGPGG